MKKIITCDDSGSIKIPKNVMSLLNITSGSQVEISVGGTEIVIRKHHNECHCCNKSRVKLTKVMGLNLCDDCIKEYDEARKLIDKLR